MCVCVCVCVCVYMCSCVRCSMLASKSVALIVTNQAERTELPSPRESAHRVDASLLVLHAGIQLQSIVCTATMSERKRNDRGVDTAFLPTTVSLPAFSEDFDLPLLPAPFPFSFLAAGVVERASFLTSSPTISSAHAVGS